MSQSILDWPDFVDLVLRKYQAWVYPFFEFLFAWVPFVVPTYVFDYLVLGIIWFSSMARASLSMPLVEFGGDILKEVRLVLFHLFLWPLSIGMTGYAMHRMKKEYPEGEGGLPGYIYETGRRSMQYLSLVLLVFVLLVIMTVVSNGFE